MKWLLCEFVVFIISFIIFTSVSTYIGFNQEPATGVTSGYSTDEIIIPDIVNIPFLLLIVSLITMICSGVLLYYECWYAE